ATLYRTFRARADVTELVSRGTCYYEVPFSYDPPDRSGERIRGLVDCLVVAADGTATVVEFKTGEARPEHQAQVAVYTDAIRAALGAEIIDFRVLYA